MAADDDEIEATPEETASDRPKVMAIPAIYVDTWYFITWKGHMRIAFGEIVEKDDDIYRTAIVMELDDAERFIRQMTSVIEERKKQESSAGS